MVKNDRLAAASSSTLFLASVQLTMFVLCRQGWHVCYQLPRVDACPASMQPQHPLLWYGNFNSSLKSLCMQNLQMLIASNISGSANLYRQQQNSACALMQCLYTTHLVRALLSSSLSTQRPALSSPPHRSSPCWRRHYTRPRSTSRQLSTLVT